MTQQFKFGDMVKSRMHPNKTLGFFGFAEVLRGKGGVDVGE